ncbi:hypothetical protein CXB51_024818 [Gossypium anomalum]|uniref:Integrase catalytic domain-containing protein n=1 Tax=Gossypium anomalum TaxID=47600 RepID=A0A8J6CMB1_9ROSI|nr:hypothetical protein CXB51_024818 [Gossypium anomalum]
MSEGIVLMGNNVLCKITGVGTIKVKMFDGVQKIAKLYVLLGSTVTGDAVIASSSLSDDDITKLWHMCLGHMSENGMAELSKRGLLDGQGICKLNLCEHCVFGKVPSRGGANYMLTFIDDFSRKVWAFFLKQKNNGLEFCSNEFNRLYKSEGIMRHLTVRHTPQQNGVAERMNRTITEKVDVEHQINTESTLQAITKIENRVASSPQYSIAKNRTRREIKPLKKYAEADLVAYALNVAEDIDANQEPSNYSEVKEGTPGVEEPRYKARLVAKGYSQIPRVDFTDVFSPVVNHSSIRALLGNVAMHDLELEQLDVKTAFLHGELEEDIYMQQPEGFIVSEKEDYICLLRKSLYGLKQSPRQWYKRFDSFMTSHDFKRSSLDSCVYFKKNSDGSFVYILLYVDDMLIAAKDKREIRKVKAQLSEEFEMKDLGPAKKILGIEILRDRKASKLYRSQKGYIEKVLCRFNMQSAKPWDLSCMLWFAQVQIYHMQSVQLADTWQIPFGRTKDRVIGYVDSDFTGDLDRRRSLTVALSTTETEYMAITEACKEAIWLKGLFSELNEDLQISTTWLVFIVEVKPLRGFMEEVENLFAMKNLFIENLCRVDREVVMGPVSSVDWSATCEQLLRKVSNKFKGSRTDMG